MIQFSFIIPFQAPNAYLQQTLNALDKLEGEAFEVVLLPDEDVVPEAFGSHGYPMTVVSTGKVGPAVKRDKGAELAQGLWLAFIDDDAYPERDWLVHVKAAVVDASVVAIAGPQLTPEEDGFWQKVSGAVYLSSLNGRTVLRYWPGPHSFDVDDWPSVNLCVRKDDFFRAGKFDSAFWPGEDTKLCLELVYGLGKRIVYVPKAIVWHHRRGSLKKHMRQCGGYGLHRGHFARKFPKTSLQFGYFLPSAFFLFLAFGWLLLWAGTFLKTLYLAGWVVFIAALLVSLGSVQARTCSWKIAACSQIYTVITYFWYGAQFVRGFFSNNISRHGLGR